MLASPIAAPARITGKIVSSQQSTMVQDVAIAACEIDKFFRIGGEYVQVLRGINLQVRQGDVQFLMGPSGSGKTTLLLILGGLLKPSAGQVRVLGWDLTAMSEAQRVQFRLKHLGFIFQDCNLFPALTAAENVEVALKLRGVRRRIAQKQARLLLEEVGIGNRACHLPRNLSGGQKQRVAIARALAGNPHLIIADEPTASMDARSGQEIVGLLRRLAKESGRTVLIVTHDPRIAHIADRIDCLEDGILTKTPLSLKR